MANRAAIYLRESDKRLASADHYGLPEQLRAAKEYCAQQGYDETTIYTDAGADSAELNRPELNRLRADMQAGLFEVIVFPRVDRSARDQALGNFIFSEAERLGIPVKFADPGEQFEDSALGRLMRTIKLYTAEADRERIRTNTQNARHARARSGKPIPGARAIYGYTWADKLKTRLVIDEPAAANLRRLFALVADGASGKQVAQQFTNEGIPTPTGKGSQWWSGEIIRMLQRTEYIGVAYAYKHVTRKVRVRLADGSMKTILRTSKRPADDPKRVRLPDGVYPPIIDQETFARVQARFARNAAEASRHNPNPEATLLRAGLVLCGECGHAMPAIRNCHMRSETYYYACRTRGCPTRGQTVRADLLDEEAWRQVCGAVFLSQWLYQQADAWAARQATRSAHLTADVGAFGQQLKDLERKRGNLEADIPNEDNAEVRAILRHQLAGLVDEVKRITALRDQAKERVGAMTERAERTKAAIEWLGTYHDRILGGEMTYQEKRELLVNLDARVIAWLPQHTPRWVLVLAWTQFLLERVENPALLPMPVGPLLPAAEEARDAGIAQWQQKIAEADGVPTAYVREFGGPQGPAVAAWLEGTGPRPNIADPDVQQALTGGGQLLPEPPAIVETPLRIEDIVPGGEDRFRLDLAPAVDYGLQSLTHPRKGTNYDSHNWMLRSF
jgi:site-specific DNA recombinase